MAKSDADEPEFPDVSVPDIDRCIQTGIFDKTFSAAACIASVGGKIFHRAVYGSPEHPPPMRKLSSPTFFDLGELTQPLGSGLAALHLASRNRLDLGASLTRTIDEFKKEELENVTVDMLLDHTSGFPTYRSYYETVEELDKERADKDKIMSTKLSAQFYRKLVADTRLEFEPGTKTQVGEINAMALGFIIENLVGLPLDVFLVRELYRELGVHEQLFFIPMMEQRQLARLNRHVFAATEDCEWRGELMRGMPHNRNVWAMGGVAGHSGLFGSVEAVWRVIHAMWESAAGDGRAFLGGAVRRFWKCSRRLPKMTRTLGWEVPGSTGVTSGRRMSKNSVGFIGTDGCAIWIDLSTDVIGVLLTNLPHTSLKNKAEAYTKLQQRTFDVIAKHGEAQPRDKEKATGSQAFYSGSVVTGGVASMNPLRGPGKP